MINLQTIIFKFNYWLSALMIPDRMKHASCMYHDGTSMAMCVLGAVFLQVYKYKFIIWIIMSWGNTCICMYSIIMV